jgi:hypothetical protein
MDEQTKPEFFTEYEQTFLDQLNKVRRKARKNARSGNPSKRVPARRLLNEIRGHVAGVTAKAKAREAQLRSSNG